MIKHSRKLLLLLLNMTVSTVSAYDAKINGIYYNFIPKAKIAEVTSVTNGSYSGNVRIPASVTYENVEYNVTSIDSRAFASCSELISITFPNSMKSIGADAFASCPRLKSVYITDLAAWCNISFKNVISSPFVNEFTQLYLNGEELNELYIPNGITSISDYAFSGYNGLISVIIGNDVTSIGKYSFGFCENLKSVFIGNNVITIGDGAFGTQSFYNNISLTDVYIGRNVTSIGEHAFYGRRGLYSISIPKSVTSIGKSAFGYCSGLGKVIVSDIAAWCNISFADAGANPLSQAHHLYSNESTEITDLIIPNGVTNIGSYVFSGCNSLISVSIPNSVKNIDNLAFSGCSGLENVFCNAKYVPNTKSNIFEGSYIEYATLHVPASSLEQYKVTTPWKDFFLIIGDCEDADGIDEIDERDDDNNAIEVDCYDIQGHRVVTPQKGINIIRMSDGTSRKVLVKKEISRTN